MKKEQNTYILSLNGGSSSLKFTLYRTDPFKLKLSGTVSRIGGKQGELEIKDRDGHVLEKRDKEYPSMETAATEVAEWLKAGDYLLKGIGHRLVQGGPEHRQPELITAQLLAELNGFIYLAPNHLPDEIRTIEIFQQAFTNIPQVACFDTSFHKDMPSHSKDYPLPPQYKAKGLIRYGFHGLSYEYIMHALGERIPRIAREKIIIAHLGNGASMAAVKNGTCVDTTMGVSPTGGLVMGTRSGDLDPEVVLFLMKQGTLSVEELDDILSKQSGLKAIAGISDIQELLKAEKNNAQAKEAITVFCYSARKFIAAMAAAMGGVDRLVFTGGIGENSAVIRQRICKDLGFLGMDLHEKKKEESRDEISHKKSRVIINVQQTNEEWMIAKHTLQLMNKK
ncbi:acetate/propionate family kinase [Pedobacter sp. L105]|uniref:acetate/propionate family kinase n=1 Tax=Pedobacter sp. L105 TaxID=1641871 RepID=UPI00131D7035|nr:acetate/propionate family kinase [Pedobacter sp. L105]